MFVTSIIKPKFFWDLRERMEYTHCQRHLLEIFLCYQNCLRTLREQAEEIANMNTYLIKLV